MRVKPLVPDTTSNIVPLSTARVEKLSHHPVSILPGEILQFAVMFHPKSTGAVSSDSSELSLMNFKRTLQIQMISPQRSEDRGVIGNNVDELIESTTLFSDECDSKTQISGKSNRTTAITTYDNRLVLKPRYLFIRGKICRSEMTILQRNINFGKITIGDVSTTSITIVNRSAVPLLYAISKSGSISSGFLTIPNGRRGQVLANSSITVNFVLKPTLPGNIEEVIQVKNILDPYNEQSLIIKAKVSKPEVFRVSSILKTVVNSIPILPSKSYNDGDSTRRSTSDAIVDAGLDVASMVMKSEPDNGLTYDCEIASIVVGAETARVGANALSQEDFSGIVDTFIPNAAVSIESNSEISFKIRNMSSRRRQFIIDSSHLNAIILEGVDKQSNVEGIKSFVTDMADATVLESIVCIRCKYEISEDLSQVNMPKLTEEEKQSYKDKLERFNQKLLIARRKNKQEKIVKYESKIQQISDILNGKSISVNNPLDDDEDEKDESKINSETKEPTASIESNDVSLQKASTYKVVVNSDITLHLELEPAVDIIITVYITCLPATSYRYWKHSLLFKGHLRVFEARNEDNVKVIPFTVELYSSIKSLLSTMRSLGVSESIIAASAQFTGSNSIVTHSGTMLDSSSEERFPTNALIMPNTHLVNPLISRFKSMNQVMLTTVSQWSSYPTKLFYPDYRYKSQNILGMSIKLVRINREGLMQGMFTIDSLMPHDCYINISILENFSHFNDIQINALNDQTNIFPIQYDCKSHGVVNISLESNSADPNDGNAILPAVPYLDEIKSYLLCKGDKLDCLLEWTPSDSLSNSINKQQKMVLGCICVQVLILPPESKISSSNLAMMLEEDGALSFQYIPFVSFHEKKSYFTINDKYLNFNDMYINTSKIMKATIENSSVDENFHYFTSLRNDTSSHQTLYGKVVVTSGQTGVINPKSVKEITVQVDAFNKVGRFEQDLWILNLKDRSDQKKLSVIANVIIDQSKFIQFPDLTRVNVPMSSPSSNANNGQVTNSSSGFSNFQFERIDFGYIQIPHVESSTSSSLESTCPSPVPFSQRPPSESLMRVVSTKIDTRYSYILRVMNTSDTNIYVTATSNLKTQCIIYTDEACFKPAILANIPISSILKLYVVIKPSLPKSGLNTSSYMSIGRELIGGIKLEFYTELTTRVSKIISETSNDFRSPEVKLNNEPLFETTLDFKAIIGQSVLTIDSINSSWKFIPSSKVIDQTAQNLLKLSTKRVSFDPLHELKQLNVSAFPDSISDRFYLELGEFAIENKSSTFELEYSFIESPACVCIPSTNRIHSLYVFQQLRALNALKPNRNIYVVIFVENLDIHSASLIQRVQVLGGSKRLQMHYGLFYDREKVSGWIKYKISVRNVSTGDVQTLKLSAFIDSNIIQSKYDSLKHCSLLTNPSSSQRLDYSTEFKCDVNKDVPAFGDLISDGTILLNNKSISNPIGQTASTVVHLSLSSNSTTSSKYQLIGSTRKILFSWTFSNSVSTNITITPVSNLPIHVHILPEFPIKKGDIEFIDNDLSVVRVKSINSTVKRESNGYKSLLALTSGHWKGSLSKCGDSVIIEGYACVRINVSVNYDAEINEDVIRDSFNLDNVFSQRCEGIVCFVNSNQALRSFFAPSPRKANTNREESSVFEPMHSVKPNLISLFHPGTIENSNSLESNRTVSDGVSELNDVVELFEVVSLTRLHVSRSRPVTCFQFYLLDFDYFNFSFFIIVG